jgi:surfeit locus 1 family protein
MMTAGFTKRLRIAWGGGCWAPPVWALLLAALGILFFCWLGIWQLHRASEKDDIISRFERNARLPPVALSRLSHDSPAEDRRVQVEGHWDNHRLVYLENQMRGPRAGFHVYTVFLPADGPSAILVNRGWIPVASDIQRLPAVPLATAIRIAGTLAFPSDYFTVAEPDYARQPFRVARVDIARLSESFGISLSPYILRLEAAAADGFVREWSPSARLGMMPDKHRAYAFQWFSLAVAVLVVVVMVNMRKKDDEGE